MFKKFFVFGLLIFGLCAAAFAQSGRRVKNPAPLPTGTPREEIPLTSNGETVEPEVGYSESAPNSARRLSVRPATRTDKKDKKDKKDKNNETKPQTTKASATVAGAEDDEILKVETSLVSIPVSVYDRNGVYIPNLTKENFKIFEDGKEQEVAYFGTSDKPFTVVLLIDVSPSTEYKIEQIQDAAIAFVNQLKPQDNVMVIQFDSNVDVLTKPELTNDRDKIFKAINNTGFGGGTSLYDAVQFSLRKKLDKIEGRKAIVLFTDGVDTTSNRADFESTVRDAEESDSLIFPIYYNTFLDGGGGLGGGGGVMSTPPGLSIPLPGGMGGMNNGSSAEHARGRAYLEELAAATGGRVFRPNSSTGGLNAAFEGIAEELRKQYNIGYYPQDEAQAGTRKQIRVRVNRPRLIIRARDSYIVGENEQTQGSK